jgi:hypothetical protein
VRRRQVAAGGTATDCRTRGLRAGYPEVNVGGDGEPVEPGALHRLHPGRFETVLRDVQHERNAESTLTSAFGQALSAARDELARTVGGHDPEGQPNQVGQLDQVLAEALAILTIPERLSGS